MEYVWTIELRFVAVIDIRQPDAHMIYYSFCESDAVCGRICNQIVIITIIKITQILFTLFIKN